MKKKKWGIFCVTGFLILAGFLLSAGKVRTEVPVPGAQQFQQGMEDIPLRGAEIKSFAVSPADPRILYTSLRMRNSPYTDLGIFRSLDGGSTWHNLSPVSYSTYPSPTDPGAIYSISGKWLYKRSDYGDTWTIISKVPLNYSTAFFAVHPAKDQIFYYCTLEKYGERYSPHYNSYVYRSMDGGGSWDLVLFIPDKSISSIVFDRVQPAIIYLDGFMKSRDWGQTWKTFGSKEFFSLVAPDPFVSTVIYGMSFFLGKVKKSTDGGLTWVDVMNGLEGCGSIYDLMVHPEFNQTVVLSCENGIFISFDSAAHWQKKRPDEANVEVAKVSTSGMAPVPLYVLSHDGEGLYKSGDGGVTWKTILPSGAPWIAISGVHDHEKVHGVVPLSIKVRAEKGIDRVTLNYEGERIESWTGNGEKALEFKLDWDTRKYNHQCMDWWQELEAYVLDLDQDIDRDRVQLNVQNFVIHISLQKVEDRGWLVQKKTWNKVVVTVENPGEMNFQNWEFTILRRLQNTAGMDTNVKSFLGSDMIDGKYSIQDRIYWPGRTYCYQCAAVPKGYDINCTFGSETVAIND